MRTLRIWPGVMIWMMCLDGAAGGMVGIIDLIRGTAITGTWFIPASTRDGMGRPMVHGPRMGVWRRAAGRPVAGLRERSARRHILREAGDSGRVTLFLMRGRIILPHILVEVGASRRLGRGPWAGLRVLSGDCVDYRRRGVGRMPDIRAAVRCVVGIQVVEVVVHAGIREQDRPVVDRVVDIQVVGAVRGVIPEEEVEEAGM